MTTRERNLTQHGRTSQRRIARHLERIRALLGHTIRRRGFTQKEIQEALGWGRSYISQLLTAQKSLRLEQVLMILNVVDVTREEFFGEAFQLGTRPAPAARPAAPALGLDRSDVEELTTMRITVECLAKLLIQSSDRGGWHADPAAPPHADPDRCSALRSIGNGDCCGIWDLLRREDTPRSGLLEDPVSSYL